MSFFVIHAPTDYNFSRNSNYVEIVTDNRMYSLERGNKAQIKLYGSWAYAAIDETFYLECDTISKTYTFKAGTNLPLGEIPIKAGTPFSVYITNIANLLNSDPDVNSHLLFRISGSMLIIESKFYGPAYNLKLSTFSISGALTQFTPGVTDVIITNRPNYKINFILQYYNLTHSVWVDVLNFALEPVDNRIRADLKEYIDPTLSYDLPDFSSLGVSFPCLNSCKTFRVKLSEIYGEIPEEHATTIVGMPTSGMDGLKWVSSPYKSLKAGFDTTSSKIRKKNQFDYYDTYNAFLTRQPRVKYLSRNIQYEWLYFKFKATPVSNVSLKQIITKKDGTTLEVFGGYTPPGIQPDDVWAFLAYDTQFRDHPDYTKIETWVWDSTDDVALSEKFTYLPDENYVMEETFFYFINSDSACETFRALGVRESLVDFEYDVIERSVLSHIDSNYEGDLVTLYNRKQNVYQVFSGWKTKKDLFHIEELFLSRKIFTYGNEYGQSIEIPLIITSKQLARNKTNQNLYGFIIEYKEANYSEISQAQHYPI